MDVKYTNRMVMEIAKLKKNITEFSHASFLEKMIDGGIIQNSENKTDFSILKAIDNECKKRNETFDIFTNSHFYRLDGLMYSMNPYIANIKVEGFDKIDEDGNRIYIDNTLYKEGELCLTDAITQKEDFTGFISFGMFDKITPITVLRQQNKESDFVWMSVNPMEMKTMQEPINRAKGNVLVLGGGIGYCSYMMSLKEEVNSVTIIEKNKVIYELLKDMIIPQMNKKVSIIKEDAFTYMENADLTQYDYIFEDIWENNVTGCELYQKLIMFENKAPNVHVDYWIEDAIIGMLRVNVLEYFSAKIGGDENFLALYSRIAPDLFKKLESDNSVIERPSQLYYYLKKDYIKNLLKKEA